MYVVTWLAVISQCASANFSVLLCSKKTFNGIILYVHTQFCNLLKTLQTVKVLSLKGFDIWIAVQVLIKIFLY